MIALKEAFSQYEMELKISLVSIKEAMNSTDSQLYDKLEDIYRAEYDIMIKTDQTFDEHDLQTLIRSKQKIKKNSKDES